MKNCGFRIADAEFGLRCAYYGSVGRACVKPGGLERKLSPINTEPRAVATGCYHFALNKTAMNDELILASGRYRSRFCSFLDLKHPPLLWLCENSTFSFSPRL